MFLLLWSVGTEYSCAVLSVDLPLLLPLALQSLVNLSIFQNCPPLFSVLLLTGVLIIPHPDLLPDIFCLTVRIFRLMLVLLYT